MSDKFFTDEELMERIRDPKEALNYLLHIHQFGNIVEMRLAMDKVARVHQGFEIKNPFVRG